MSPGYAKQAVVENRTGAGGQIAIQYVKGQPADGATLLQTPVLDTVNSNSLKFITGQRPLSEWDTYVKECDAKGAAKYLEMVNAAYKKTK